MTVIEVLVAMVILVVGVLGIFSMLDTGNNVTARNLTREAGTSLAREEVERARQIVYGDLADPAKVGSALALDINGSGPRVDHDIRHRAAQRHLIWPSSGPAGGADEPVENGVAPDQVADRGEHLPTTARPPTSRGSPRGSSGRGRPRARSPSTP